ncbi:hypothetical protein A9Q74_08760 [Colwellia sp. 39_35_sub15_T18]|nr:hypothetical protein A9Q74_08760 [Colwellia sp. 39_35_sub15_T18]
MLNITILITGCGGGDEKGNNSSTESVESPSPIEISTQNTIATSDLMSTPDFDFISDANLEVTLPISPSTAVSYFINICTDFSDENNKVKINYDSCKLRTLLTTQEQLFNLSLSTAEFRLLAQIWPIENSAKPINIYWDISKSGKRWKITI